MTTTAQRTHGSRLPLTAGQSKLMDDLMAKAIRNDDDAWTYRDRLIERLGDPYTLVEGAEAWRPEFLDRTGEQINRATASACIDILKAMATEPRCEGYCGERGVQHSKVRYYDDHYDWECGLS